MAILVLLSRNSSNIAHDLCLQITYDESGILSNKEVRMRLRKIEEIINVKEQSAFRAGSAGQASNVEMMGVSLFNGVTLAQCCHFSKL